MLDPLLPLLVRGLGSRHAGTASLALRSLSFLVPLPLPGMLRLHTHALCVLPWCDWFLEHGETKRSCFATPARQRLKQSHIRKRHLLHISHTTGETTLGTVGVMSPFGLRGINDQTVPP